MPMKCVSLLRAFHRNYDWSASDKAAHDSGGRRRSRSRVVVLQDTSSTYGVRRVRTSGGSVVGSPSSRPGSRTASGPRRGSDLVKAGRYRRNMTALALIVVVALGAVVLHRVLPRYRYGLTGTCDWVEYWSAARLLWSGQDPYDPDAMLRIQRSVGSELLGPILMWNPPWLLLRLSPVLFPPFPVSALAWVGLNIALLLAGALLARGAIPAGTRLEPRAAWLAAGLFLALTSVKPHVVYLLWIVAAWWVVVRGRWSVVAGRRGGNPVDRVGSDHGDPLARRPRGLPTRRRAPAPLLEDTDRRRPDPDTLPRHRSPLAVRPIAPRRVRHAGLPDGQTTRDRLAGCRTSDPAPVRADGGIRVELRSNHPAAGMVEPRLRGPRSQTVAEGACRNPGDLNPHRRDRCGTVDPPTRRDHLLLVRARFGADLHGVGVRRLDSFL